MGVPTALPWMLIKRHRGHLAGRRGGGSPGRRCRPAVVLSTPNSRSAASLAQISRAGGVDHDDGVGQPDSHVEQASRFDHQDSIGCGGLRP